MSFNDLEAKLIEKELKAFISKRRPPVAIRSQVDLAYKIEKNSVIIFETRPQWNLPEEMTEIPLAKATYDKTNEVWKIFWKRADLKWHKYDPAPRAENISEFIEIVDKDDYRCFWG
jgi:hypothetical protein